VKQEEVVLGLGQAGPNRTAYAAIYLEKPLKRDGCFPLMHRQGSIPHETPGLISELGSAWRPEAR
jgi:hypothetical protein